MSLHESRLSLVWERTVEAMAALDTAAYEHGIEPNPVVDTAMSELESILILSRGDLPEAPRTPRKRPTGPVLTGLEVPLHG